MTDDRATIRLTPDGSHILASLVKAGWFETEVAAFQFAVSLALARGLSMPLSSLRGSTTKFQTGTLDPLVREIVATFTEGASERPYERATVLGEAGLRDLQGLLDETVSLADLVGDARD